MGRLEEMAVNERLTNVPEEREEQPLPWEYIHIILFTESWAAPNLFMKDRNIYSKTMVNSMS